VLGQTDSGDNLRPQLLYWKEALYSPSKKLSYRQLSPDVATYWAAYDLYKLLPPYHPHSAEFFLREALRAALGDAAPKQKCTLLQFCSALRHELMPGSLWPNAVSDERLTLLDAIHGVAGSHIGVETVPQRTGVPAEAHVPREELAVWVFRDLQAQHLASGS
jgi:hypothetical protein